MSNTQLLANNHSALFKSVEKASSENKFVFDLSPSSKNVSSQMLKISPQSNFSASATARSTMSFQLPSSGFLHNMYLVFAVESTNADQAESSWPALAYIESVNLSSRGQPLRECNDLAILHDTILSEPNPIVKANRVIGVGDGQTTTAKNTTHKYYVDVGKALGILAPKDCYDTLSLERLTLNVVFRAVAEANTCTGAKYTANSGALYCVYHQLDSDVYLQYQNEVYSSDKESRRLITGWKHENEVEVSGTDTKEADITIDINHKGLLKESVFCLQNKTLRDASDDSLDRYSLNSITSVTLYAGGVRIWESDDFNVDSFLHNNHIPAKAVRAGDNEITKANNSENVFHLNYSMMGLDDSPYFDKISGCLNTGDLSSVYAEITFTANATVTFVGRMSHRVYMMEAVDGKNGQVSSSAKV